MNALDALGQDLRFSTRLARRNPFLTCAVIVTLALGVGLDAGVFTVVDGAVRRPRVEHDPDSFVHVQVDFETPTRRSKSELFSTTGADYTAYRDSVESLSALAAWHIIRPQIEHDARATLAMLVSCNFFSVYGLERPLIGRPFTSADCAGVQRLVVISEEVWRGRFEADAQILDKSIDINGVSVAVIGVLPANFAGQLRGPGYWMPLGIQPLFFKNRDLIRDPNTPWLALEGRRRAGFSRAAAERELNALAAHQDRQHVGRSTTISLTDGSVLADPLLGRTAAWVVFLMMGGLALVLGIACANVAVLLLSRAAARQREMVIRISLGASRRRLVGMLLAESMFLSLTALPLSAYVAYQVPRIAKVMVPMLPYYNMRPNIAAFAYMVLVTAVAGCVAGLAPATESLRSNLSNRTHGGDRFHAFGTRWRIRDVLIASQIAMSAVLLIGSGIFVRTQSAIRHHESGIDAEHTLVVPLNLAASKLPLLAERVRAIPGVRSTAFASDSPLATEAMPAAIVRRNDQPADVAGRTVAVSTVSSEYFETLKLPILRGRSFARTSAANEVVISQSLARALWSSDDAVGGALVDESARRLSVVGVVRDVDTLSASTAIVYRRRMDAEPGAVLLANAGGSAASVGAQVRQAVLQLDPAAIVQPRTLAAEFDELAKRFSVLVRFVAFLGVVGIVLAVIGVHGVVAYVVSGRTKEIGIRMALGATKPVIMRLLLSSGVAPVAVGLAAGFLVAIGGVNVLRRVLTGAPVPLDVRDPLVFGLVGALLVVTALGAMCLPAWRATASSPIDALRQE